MADEKPANTPAGANGDDDIPQIVVPSHGPLPPPPEVHYSRPTSQRPSPSSAPRGPDPMGGRPSSDDGGGFTKLGAGMAAATTFVASVVAGLLIGQWIDHRWGRPGATPWGTLVFSLLGVAAGFLNLFRVLAATDRGQKKVTPMASRRGFPAFRPLAVTAFAANAPLLAWFLIGGRLWTALSALAGLGIGLAVYGSVYLFVGRGLDPLLPSIRGRAKPSTGGMTALFALLLPLKYLVLGGLMFLLARRGHLNLFWFAVDFMITQVAITSAAVAHLARHPRQ